MISESNKDENVFNEKQMETDAEELKKLFTGLHRLLEKHDEKQWIISVDKALKIFTNHPEKTFTLCKEILGWYGTMGAINDLVIHPLNHHIIDKEELDSVNQQIQEILWKIHAICWKYRAW